MLCGKATGGSKKKEGRIRIRDTTTAFFMDGKDCNFNFHQRNPGIHASAIGFARLIHPFDPAKALYKPHK